MPGSLVLLPSMSLLPEIATLQDSNSSLLQVSVFLCEFGKQGTRPEPAPTTHGGKYTTQTAAWSPASPGGGAAPATHVPNPVRGGAGRESERARKRHKGARVLLPRPHKGTARRTLGPVRGGTGPGTTPSGWLATKTQTTQAHIRSTWQIGSSPVPLTCDMVCHGGWGLSFDLYDGLGHSGNEPGKLIYLLGELRHATLHKPPLGGAW
jgi:hypothetical protein